MCCNARNVIPGVDAITSALYAEGLQFNLGKHQGMFPKQVLCVYLIKNMFVKHAFDHPLPRFLLSYIVSSLLDNLDRAFCYMLLISLNPLPSAVFSVCVYLISFFVLMFSPLISRLLTLISDEHSDLLSEIINVVIYLHTIGL